MRYNPIKKATLFLFLYSYLELFALQAFAIDNGKEDRARVVAPRNDMFYKNGRVRQYVNLSAEYESDQNSKQFVLLTGHFYKSNKLINETDFLKQNDYKQKDNGQVRRSSDIYDFQMSTKYIPFNNKEYLIFYHRTRYDDFSTYYYDITTAFGVGKMLLDDKLEVDISIGHNEVKEYDQKTTFIPSFRAEFDITKNLHFIQRGYMFFSDEALDYQLRTRLQFPINRKLYFQITHDFDKREYVKKSKDLNLNEVHRRFFLGFRYEIGG